MHQRVDPMRCKRPEKINPVLVHTAAELNLSGVQFSSVHVLRTSLYS